MWVLGIASESSGRAGGALNRWAVSPVPHNILVTALLSVLVRMGRGWLCAQQNCSGTFQQRPAEHGFFFLYLRDPMTSIFKRITKERAGDGEWGNESEPLSPPKKANFHPDVEAGCLSPQSWVSWSGLSTGHTHILG